MLRELLVGMAGSMLAQSGYEKVSYFFNQLKSDVDRDLFSVFAARLLRDKGIEFSTNNVDFVKSELLKELFSDGNYTPADDDEVLVVCNSKQISYRDVRNASYAILEGLADREEDVGKSVLNSIFESQAQHFSNELNLRENCSISTGQDKKSFVANTKKKLKEIQILLGQTKVKLNISPEEGEVLAKKKMEFKHLDLYNHFKEMKYRHSPVNDLDSYTFVLESENGMGSLYIKVFEDLEDIEQFDFSVEEYIKRRHDFGDCGIRYVVDDYTLLKSKAVRPDVRSRLKHKNDILGIEKEVREYRETMLKVLEVDPEYAYFRATQGNCIDLRMQNGSTPCNALSYMKKVLKSSLFYYCINGKPGAGKSILCLNFVKDLLENDEFHVPIYVDLGSQNLNLKRHSSSAALKHFAYASCGGHLSNQTIKRLLCDNRIVLIFDGVDELIQQSGLDKINYNIKVIDRIISNPGIRSFITVRANYLDTYFSRIRDNLKYIGTVLDLKARDCKEYFDKIFCDERYKEIVYGIYLRDNRKIFSNLLNIPRALNAFVESLLIELTRSRLESYSYLSILNKIHSRWLYGNPEGMVHVAAERNRMLDEFMMELAICDQKEIDADYLEKMCVKNNEDYLNIQTHIMLSPLLKKNGNNYSFFEPMRTYYAFRYYDGIIGKNSYERNWFDWSSIFNNKYIKNELLTILFVDAYSNNENEFLFKSLLRKMMECEKFSHYCVIGHILRNMRLGQSSYNEFDFRMRTYFTSKAARIEKDDKIDLGWNDVLFLCAFHYQLFVGNKRPSDACLESVKTLLESFDQSIDLNLHSKNRRYLNHVFYFCLLKSLYTGSLGEYDSKIIFEILQDPQLEGRGVRNRISLWLTLYLLIFSKNNFRKDFCLHRKHYTSHTDRHIRSIAECIQDN